MAFGHQGGHNKVISRRKTIAKFVIADQALQGSHCHLPRTGLAVRPGTYDNGVASCLFYPLGIEYGIFTAESRIFGSQRVEILNGTMQTETACKNEKGQVMSSYYPLAKSKTEQKSIA